MSLPGIPGGARSECYHPAALAPGWGQIKEEQWGHLRVLRPLMERVRARVGDKRVLALVKAFLKAGILTEDGVLKDTDTGTPQGGLCSAT